MIGTLMWVGDTVADEFRAAVQYCLLNVSQLAFRRDTGEAIARPASDVRWIVFAQSNRSGVDTENLANRYPDAKTITLLGPLCQGIGFTGGNECCDWYHWNAVLPEWLGIERPVKTRCQTVAVIASTFNAAEPLLELVESVGATAFWCPQPSGQRIRNVDAVWWDDSVAKPVSEALWQHRIEAFSGLDRPVQHAWIVNSPRMQDAQEARAAGVQWLVSKPYRIDSLVGMLNQRRIGDRLIQRQAA